MAQQTLTSAGTQFFYEKGRISIELIGLFCLNHFYNQMLDFEEATPAFFALGGLTA